jgi:hypothetical protein
MSLLRPEEIAQSVSREKRLMHAFALAEDYRKSSAHGDLSAARHMRVRVEALCADAFSDPEIPSSVLREMPTED